MEVSPQAFEFANLVLNHYDIKKKQTSKTEEEPIENPNNPNPIPDIKTKYSMDYKKFEALSKETEIKPSQAEDPFKTNPYLAQMGCSHDRRKVIKLRKNQKSVYFLKGT